jgi:hypothetical protein
MPEYWNSEPEDEDRTSTGMSESYLDMLNDPSFPSTIGSDFTVGSTSNDSTNFNHAFNTGTGTATSIPSVASDLPVSNNPENVDILHWVSYDPSSNTGATTYNFDLMPAAAQGPECSFDNDEDYRDLVRRFGFDSDPIMATSHSPHLEPDLLLPLPVFASGSSPPGSYLVPQDSERVPDNPNKRLRISDITEENILPDNHCRKRSKPDKLSL